MIPLNAQSAPVQKSMFGSGKNSIDHISNNNLIGEILYKQQSRQPITTQKSFKNSGLVSLQDPEF